MSNLFDKILQSDEFGEEFFVAQFQSRLANMLDDKGISKAELARKLGVSRARVSQIFSDDAKDFSIRLVYRSYAALGDDPIIITKSEYQYLKMKVSEELDNIEGETLVDEPATIGLPADLIAELLRANLTRASVDSQKAIKSSGDAKQWTTASPNVIPFREKACA